MALTRVRTVFTGVPGTPWMSNMYFDVELAEVQLAADAVEAFWSEVDGYMVGGVAWEQEPFVTIINPVNGEPTGVAPVTPGAGTGGASGDMVPRAAQAYIVWNTGVWQAGRQIRGRTYLPGFTAGAAASDGSVDPGVVTALATAASNLLTTPGNPTLHVYSRKNGNSVPVDNGAASNQWAVLRSRRD